MYFLVKKLPTGQLDGNVYWYYVSFEDGRPDELVSLARISAINDRSRGVIDEDGSLQVFTPRLSALGGLDLLAWLRTHEAELQAAAGIAREVVALSEQVMCQSCHLLIDPNELTVHTCPAR